MIGSKTHNQERLSSFFNRLGLQIEWDIMLEVFFIVLGIFDSVNSSNVKIFHRAEVDAVSWSNALPTILN
jgi:hypothetical protein